MSAVSTEKRWSQLLLETSVDVRSKTQERPMYAGKPRLRGDRTEPMWRQSSCRTEHSLSQRHAGNWARQKWVWESEGQTRVSGERVKLQILYPIQKSRSKQGQPGNSGELCLYPPKRKAFRIGFVESPTKLEIAGDFKRPLAMMLLNSKCLHLGVKFTDSQSSIQLPKCLGLLTFYKSKNIH